MPVNVNSSSKKYMANNELLSRQLATTCSLLFRLNHRPLSRWPPGSTRLTCRRKATTLKTNKQTQTKQPRQKIKQKQNEKNNNKKANRQNKKQQKQQQNNSVTNY